MKIRLVTGEAGLARIIDHPRIQKPSLAFAGFTKHLSDFRLQVIGETELHYLETRTPEQQSSAINNFFDLRVAAVIVTRGVSPSLEIITAAERTETPLLVSELSSSEFMIGMMQYLSKRLAPKTTHHAVFMDVFGQGVLLLADGGIGKSEIALELITRGHRLVADDIVELFHEASDTLVGRCPEYLQDYLEVRGLGFINVRNVFGSAAITQSKRVTLVVNCIDWDNFPEESRAENKVKTVEINGVLLPSVVIPIRPGRSMAVLIEVAARSESMRKLGMDDNKTFIDQMNARIIVADKHPPTRS
ncbi:MAG: HPr(Ser) kinase/phosphatase [Mariprofundaceae bacterium]|nr:HPr(Ser) kinase/phosphatase [Mariprofundaceae bacterium]